MKSFNSIKPMSLSDEERDRALNNRKKKFEDIDPSDFDFGVDSDYISSFLDDAGSFLNNAQNDYGKIDYNNAKSLYDTKSSESAELKSRANTIRAYLNTHKDVGSDDYRTQLFQYLDNFDTASSSIFNGYRRASENMRNFSSNTDYEGAKMVSLYTADYDDTTSYSDVAGDIQKLQQNRNAAAHRGADTSVQDKAIEMLKKYADQRYSLSGAGSNSSTAQERQARYNANVAELDDLTAEKGRVSARDSAINRWLEYYDDNSIITDEDNQYFIDMIKNDTGYDLSSFVGGLDSSGRESKATELRDLISQSSTKTGAIDSRISELTNENNAYRRNNPEDFVSSYEELRNADDFEEKSQRPKLHGRRGSVGEERRDKYSIYADERFNEDIDTSDGGYVYDIITEGDENCWDAILVREKEMYYYLLNTQGQDAAYKYLDLLTPVLQKRQTRFDQEEYQDVAETMRDTFGIPGSLALAPVEIVGGVSSFLDNTAHTLRGEEINPYNRAHHYSNMTSAVMDSDVQAIDEATDGANIGGFSLGDAYQGLYSGYKSMLLTVTSSPAVASLIMSTDAAQSKATELYNRGATNEQITEGALSAGVFEYVFEKVSLDTIVNKVIAKNATKAGISKYIASALMSAGIEGSEEVNTEIANYIADQVIMRDHSERQTLIRQYIDEGYSEEEATKKANEAFIQSLYESFMGGAVGGAFGGTGMMLSSGQEAVQNIKDRRAYNQYTNQVGEAVTSAGNTQELIDQAYALEGDSKAVKNIQAQADKVSSLSAKQGTGNRFSNWVNDKRTTKAAGKLYTSMQENNISRVASAEETEIKTALSKAYAEKIKADVNDKSVSKVVDALYKSEYTNEPLSRSEQRMISSDNAKAALSDVQSNNDVIRSQINRAQRRATEDMASTAALTGTKERAAEKPAKIDIDDFNLSDDGKTYTADGGEQVDIKSISSLDADDIRVELSNGKTESVKALDLGSEDQAVVYQGIMDIQTRLGAPVTASFANAVVNEYNQAKAADANLSTTDFIYGVEEAVRKGYMNDNGGNYAVNLSESAREALFDEGRKIAQEHTKAQQKSVQSRIKGDNSQRKGSVTYEDGIERSQLNERQQVGVDVVTHIAEETGIDVVFFRSTKDGKGRYSSNFITKNSFSENGQAPNGFWHNGKMYIDVNAGMNGEGLILFTAAHEIVHMIREGSPESFKALADFLVENYAKKGVDVNKLILKEMTRSTNLNYDAAYEEVIAQSCESFLRDIHLSDKAEQLYKTDKGLATKIKNILNRILNAVKKWYGVAKPQSVEANYVSEMKDALSEAYDRYIAGIRAASENLRNIEKPAVKGGAKFSIRKTQKMGYADQLEQIEKRILNGSNSLYVGIPSDSLQKIGITNAPFVMNQADYRKARRKSGNNKHYSSHSVPYDFFESMPDRLSDIGMAIDNGNKVTLVTDYLMDDTNGNEAFVIAGFWQNQPMESDTVNQIKSVYPLDDTVLRIKDAAEKGILVVIDEKKAENMFATIGVQPSEVSRILNLAQDSLSQSADKVKRQSRSDADYLSAVERGDMETAQRMVDEAAERAFAKSKIRDEDGKLMKVYHGTDADFTVFDRAMGRANMDIQGLFFSPWDIDAGGYGSNVRAFYLNITNPADESTGYKALNSHKGENYAGIKAREDLERMGYDGVNNSDEEYIAFNSEQIKLADPVTYDDNGDVIPLSKRFDSTNPDIRYQDRGAFDIDLFDDADDSVENIFAREFVTHHEDIGEVLKNIAVIDLAPKKISSVINRVIRDNFGTIDPETRNTLAYELQIEMEFADRQEDYDRISDNMISAVRKAINEAKVTDDRADSNYRDFLSVFKGNRYYLTENQIADLKEHDMSLADFRKKMFGKLNIVSRENALKSAGYADAQELSLEGLYDVLEAPEEYLPYKREQWDEYGYHAPMIIMETMDKLRNSISTPLSEVVSEEEMDDIAVQLTAKITGGIVEAKYNSKQNPYVTKLVADLKQKRTEAVNKQKEKNRQKLAELKQKERERAEKREQDIRQKYREQRAKNVEKRNLTKNKEIVARKLRSLDKKLNRSDKDKTVKESLRPTAAKLLEIADMLFPESLSLEQMAREGVSDATPAEQKLLASYIKALEVRDKATTKAGRQNANDALANIRNQLSKEGVMVEVEENGKIIKKKMSITARERMRYDNAVRANNDLHLKSALDELAAAYRLVEKAEEGYYAESFDPDIIDAITELRDSVGETLAKDMTMDQLGSLNLIVSRLLKSIHNANRLFLQERSMSDTAQQVMNDIARNRTLKDSRNIVAYKAAEFLGWNNFKPIYAMRFIGSDTFTRLYWNVQKGECDWYVDLAEAKAFKDELDKKYGVGKLNTKKKADFNYKKTATFTALDGSTFTLNLNQIMDIYAASRRPQALQHLLLGGFTFAKESKGDKALSQKTGAKVYQLTAETISSIADQLSTVEKKYVEEMQEYLSTVMADKGNEVSMKLHGIKLFNEEVYWNISSTDIYAPQSQKEQENKVNLVRKLRNAGFTKSTVHNASNPIVLQGFEENWCNHVNEMSLYHAMTLPLEDFTKVTNYRLRGKDDAATTGVRGVMNQAFGNAASNYINRLIDDLNGGITPNIRTGAEKFISLSKKGAVLLNLSVVVQQPSAIFRAMAHVDKRYFVLATGNKFWDFSDKKFSWRKHNEMYEQLIKYAPIAGIKRMGSFDTGAGRGVLDWLSSGGRDSVAKRAYNAQDNIASFLPEKADELAWLKLWQAIQHETKAKHGYSIGLEENLVKSGERFNEVVHLTQVYDSVLSRSQNMRAKDEYHKMVTAFMGEPTTYMNMAVDATVQAKRTGNKRQFLKTMSSLGIALVANALLVAIPRAMRDDDDDEKLSDKYSQAFLEDIISGINPMNYFPILKDVMSLIEGYNVDRMDMTLIADAIKVVSKTGKNVFEHNADGQDVLNILQTASQFAGIPFKNLVRDIRSVINTVNTVNNEKYYIEADEMGLKLPYVYQKAYDKAWDEGWSEAECVSKGETAARKEIAKAFKEKYLECLKNNDTNGVKEIRQYMVQSGYYHSKKKNGTTLSAVDDALKSWRDGTDEADERAKVAKERKKNK